MAQPSPGASPGLRRRSDGSVRECLFFPVSERNEQERLEALVRRRTGGADRRGGGGNNGGEARDHLENRPKRWTWGGPPDGVEGEWWCQRFLMKGCWWGVRRRERWWLRRRSGGQGGGDGRMQGGDGSRGVTGQREQNVRRSDGEQKGQRKEKGVEAALQEELGSGSVCQSLLGVQRCGWRRCWDTHTDVCCWIGLLSPTGVCLCVCVVFSADRLVSFSIEQEWHSKPQTQQATHTGDSPPTSSSLVSGLFSPVSPRSLFWGVSRRLSW